MAAGTQRHNEPVFWWNRHRWSPLGSFFTPCFSFLYGLIHAVGPGHRKALTFSLFLGQETRWKEPLSAGFLSAGLHGGLTLFLLLIFYAISKNRLNKIQSISTGPELVLYLLIIAYSAWSVYPFVMSLWRFSQQFKRKRLTPLPFALKLLRKSS